MKKILNWYKTGWGYLSSIGKWVILILMGGVTYFTLVPEVGYFWAILIYFTFMSVVIWKAHADVNEIERRKKFLENKYGGDPDWEKYKELCKKFPKL